MTLSRRSFLGRGLAALGGAVAAAKLGSAPKRAEVARVTTDLATAGNPVQVATPSYLSLASESVRGTPVAATTSYLNSGCETLFPYDPAFALRYDGDTTYRWLGTVPGMREWSGLSVGPNDPRDAWDAAVSGPGGIIDQADKSTRRLIEIGRAKAKARSHAPGARYTPTNYGGTWTFPRRHTRLLFAEPRPVKRRG